MKETKFDEFSSNWITLLECEICRVPSFVENASKRERERLREEDR